MVTVLGNEVNHLFGQRNDMDLLHFHLFRWYPPLRLSLGQFRTIQRDEVLQVGQTRKERFEAPI
jgi:hypothetical protein